MKIHAAVLTLLLAASAVLADETITRGSNLSVDVVSDGRLAMDLVGELWTVPLGGGAATKVVDDRAALVAGCDATGVRSEE